MRREILFRQEYNKLPIDEREALLRSARGSYRKTVLVKVVIV